MCFINNIILFFLIKIKSYSVKVKFEILSLTSEITTLIRITEETSLKNDLASSGILIQIVKSKNSLIFYSFYNGSKSGSRKRANKNMIKTNSWYEIIFSKNYRNSSLNLYINDIEKNMLYVSESFLNGGFAIKRNLGKIYIGGDEFSELAVNFKSLRIYYENSINLYDLTQICVKEVCETGISPDKCTSCNATKFLKIQNEKNLEGICSENCDLNKIKSKNPFIIPNREFVELIKLKDSFNEIKYYFSSFQLSDLNFPIKQLINKIK